MFVKRSVGRGAPGEEASDDAPECLGRAEERIVGAEVADLFTLDSILLVSERKYPMSDEGYVVRVMQRCLGGYVDSVVDGDVDVTEAEWRGAGFRTAGLDILGRLEEPEERDNDEINDVGVENPVFFVIGVEGVAEGPHDGEVARVGSRGRFVLVFEGFEESMV